MATKVEIRLTAPSGLSYLQPVGLFINDEWVLAKSGETLSTIDPADESEICTVQSAGAADVDDAVRAARRAAKSWKRVSGTERGRLLYKLSDLVEQHATELATIDAWDSGKTITSTLSADLPDCIGALRYYAGSADKLHGQVIEPDYRKFAYTLREPHGVCALIVPWNYPLINVIWKLAPALAAGNTVVIKVAEQTPLSALYFANLVKQVGIPAGVVNILNGLGRTAGSQLLQHPGVDMISFTGSTATAREIMRQAAGTLKHVCLEAGGKSPLLVFEDADLEQAAKWAHMGIMSNQGQICSATSRILVQRGVYTKFVSLFKDAVKSTSIVGNPFADESFQGPQVTRAQFEKVLAYIAKGKEEGAKVELGGKAVKDFNGKGLYIEPTVFTDVTSSMAIYREEIFGPVVIICPFDTEEEAIEQANDTEFGLGAAIFSTNGARAHSIAREIESGTVWINSSNDADYRIPFGGKKQSGIGVEWGEQGILDFTSSKSIHVNLSSRL